MNTENGANIPGQSGQRYSVPYSVPKTVVLSAPLTLLGAAVPFWEQTTRMQSRFGNKPLECSLVMGTNHSNAVPFLGTNHSKAVPFGSKPLECSPVMGTNHSKAVPFWEQTTRMQCRFGDKPLECSPVWGTTYSKAVPFWEQTIILKFPSILSPTMGLQY